MRRMISLVSFYFRKNYLVQKCASQDVKTVKPLQTPRTPPESQWYMLAQMSYICRFRCDSGGVRGVCRGFTVSIP